jgi:predicted Zn-dependent protease
MKKYNITKICFVLLVIFIFQNCATNPFTGKRTLAITPNSSILPMSFQQYDQVISQSKVVSEGAQAEMIRDIGQKIAVASEKWLKANGFADHTKDYAWEFSLIDENTINAWAMPGGKIAFYTGILPVAQNQNGIATIMGHEIAHALANHGQQRMSAGTLQQSIGAIGALALSDNQRYQEMFMLSYGIGSQVGVMLPFSRNHETEADEIGLMLMAIAGYNPEEGAELWKRMGAASGGSSTPQFMSTHPSTDARVKNLTQQAIVAKKEAKKFGVTTFEANLPIQGL